MSSYFSRPQAASGRAFIRAIAASSTSVRSGLSVTTPICDQSRVDPGQRRGWRSRACSYSTWRACKTSRDGLGYDVLSFDADGKERLIEVKTTSFGKETPFFVTEGELTRSRQDHEHFHLYRLFDFRHKPRLFSLQGALDRHCTLDPHTYRASFS